MNPRELIREAEDEEIVAVLERPDEHDFRSQEEDFVGVNPDNPWIKEASVDVSNRNVEVHFNMQSAREKYVNVFSDEDFSVVESHGTYTVQGRSGKSVLYYFVNGDDIFLYSDGWEEYFNPRPGEVAGEAQDLYEKAVSGSDMNEMDWGSDDYVPPPENDSLFD